MDGEAVVDLEGIPGLALENAGSEIEEIGQAVCRIVYIFRVSNRCVGYVQGPLWHGSSRRGHPAPERNCRRRGRATMQIRSFVRRLLNVARRLTDGSTSRQTWYRITLRIRGVDVSGVGLVDLGLDGSRAHEYSDSGFLVNQLFRAIPGGDAVLDIGCGKGGAMLSLLRHFTKVDGIELAHAMVDTARRNLRRHRRRCQIVCADATTFDQYGAYDTFYLYNPFPAEVLGPVVEKIRQQRPDGRIIYLNPRFPEVLEGRGFREISRVMLAGHAASVYRSATSVLQAQSRDGPDAGPRPSGAGH
jgi:SAM-dependent methyltransferase